MTAITVTEFSREDLHTNVLSGTGKRRAKFYLRFTSAGTGETLDLATLDSTITDIEGINYETDDGANVGSTGTDATWSDTTLTSNTAGVEEMCITCTLI